MKTLTFALRTPPPRSTASVPRLAQPQRLEVSFVPITAFEFESFQVRGL